MGWAIGALSVFVILLLTAGVFFVFTKRYSINWQCGARDLWLTCEEWRRKLAWLWAPREEKVGLVKAQHPTAQVPGLYRQSSTNSSQYIMTSDCDLRLDAREGAFTRFEAVDRDLHSPPKSGTVSTSASVNSTNGVTLASVTNQQPQQQQQQQPIASIPPQPLRPAPQPRATARPRPSPLRAVEMLRQRECEPVPLTPPPPPLPSMAKLHHHRANVFVFQRDKSPASPTPPPLPPPPASAHVVGVPKTAAFAMMFNESDRQRSPFHTNLLASSQEVLEASRKIRYNVQGAALTDQLFDVNDETNSANNESPPYGSYDIVHETTPDFDPIYPNQNKFICGGSRNRSLEDLDRIARYIQSLPDVAPEISPTTARQHFFDNGLTEDDDGDEEVASPAAPPPPAPPDSTSKEEDPETEGEEERFDGQEPTTGEKIFKALRAVTSQSYIDANEFYNSILSSAQQVQNLVSQATIENERLDNSKTNSPYKQALAPTASDLFSLELNQEAERTAKQVSSSLQDPATSSLHMKEVAQPVYNSYHSDPSFTRTSEDIFNSLEHRRISVQDRLNGFQELLEHEVNESERRRSSQELLNALEEVQMKRRLSQIFEDVGNDNGEVVPDPMVEPVNGTGSRRGSIGQDLLINLEDLSSLQRAISCESVCSDTSVVLNDLESEAEERPVVGLICIGLEHDRWPTHTGETDLIVSVLEARDLIIPDGRPAQNTFARVSLLPERQAYVQTRLYKGTDSPSYQEKFYFPLDDSSFGRSFLVEVFSYELPNDDCVEGEACLLGEASLRWGPAPRPPATTWLPLVSPDLPLPQLGDLLFSLSYLPTAERLTLVVVKAKNLKGAIETTSGDFFVKVYLLQQGKKVHKKRTSIKRGEKSPIFNEAIIFNVPAHSLQNIQLRLTVAEVSGDLNTTSKAYSVGHIIVGASTTGRALAHWRQMLGALRRPVAMWHPLRK